MTFLDQIPEPDKLRLHAVKANGQSICSTKLLSPRVQRHAKGWTVYSQAETELVYRGQTPVELATLQLRGLPWGLQYPLSIPTYTVPLTLRHGDTLHFRFPQGLVLNMDYTTTTTPAEREATGV